MKLKCLPQSACGLVQSFRPRHGVSPDVLPVMVPQSRPGFPFVALQPGSLHFCSDSFPFFFLRSGSHLKSLPVKQTSQNSIRKNSQKNSASFISAGRVLRSRISNVKYESMIILSFAVLKNDQRFNK